MLVLIRFILNLLAGLLFTLISLIGLAGASLLLLVFYCSYRFIWLFSGKAAIERSKGKFKRQQQKLLRQAQNQRANYSRAFNHQDITELIVQIEQQLQIHQQFIDAHLISELDYLLERYQQDLNFEKTLRIHAIVTETDASLLNTALSELLNDTTSLD